MVAPRFTKLLNDCHITEGEPVTLIAAVIGEPTPAVSWFKDTIPLSSTEDIQVSCQEKYLFKCCRLMY